VPGVAHMSPVAPLLRIPVGVVVERRKATSQWVDVVWRPVAVLGGLPDAAPWTPLAGDGETATFYAGGAEIELYRSEADNYRRNLASPAPAVWVALQESGGDPPYAVAAVTADPAEGEGLTEPVQGIIEAVAMPEPLRQAIAAFVAEHHVEHVFKKRTRDRAHPEALARRGPRRRSDDER
ncbi:MAG TPA: DUF3305 domain-containing protein, partial [Stellaceae bacterium]|nr:DUF3305 domain-containing protein [Stellaceae bacterium]